MAVKKIVDTVYLVAYLNKKHEHHNKAARIMNSLGTTTRVSQASLIELDLLMKTRGFSDEERMLTWELLERVVDGKVEPLLPNDFRASVKLSRDYGMDYFDSLVASQCINRGATPLTTDREIRLVVEREAGVPGDS